MSLTDTSNLRAISLSVSPDWTTYVCTVAGGGVLVGAAAVAATCVCVVASRVGTDVGIATRGTGWLASHIFKTIRTVTAETMMLTTMKAAQRRGVIVASAIQETRFLRFKRI